MAGQVWRGRPFFYAAQYGYLKYHTVIAALEIGWEKSGLERSKAWLAMGKRGLGRVKNIRGYPVESHEGLHWAFRDRRGKTAAERRKSRVAIWQRQAAFAHGVLYPQTDGRSLFLVATAPEAVALLDSDPDVFLKTGRGSFTF